jgi:hypothetical protein
MEERMKINSRRSATAMVAAVVAAGLLGACGGSGGAESPEVASLDEGTATTDTSNSDGTDNSAVTQEDREQALLDYAECMRDHGIDMPDPKISSDEGGGILIEQEEGADIDPESDEFQQADEACQPILDDAMGDIEVDPEQQAEMREQLLEFAQCMRDHGIDMEDPVFDENGRVQIKTNGPVGGGGDPRDDEDFQAAQEACSQDGGMFGREVGPGGEPQDGDE